MPLGNHAVAIRPPACPPGADVVEACQRQQADLACGQFAGCSPAELEQKRARLRCLGWWSTRGLVFAGATPWAGGLLERYRVVSPAGPFFLAGRFLGAARAGAGEACEGKNNGRPKGGQPGGQP